MKPETTDSFDLGARYITGRFQAQSDVAGRSTTRTASSPRSTRRPTSRSTATSARSSSWGFDAGVGFKPIRALNLIGLLSYTNAKLKDDVLIGTTNYNASCAADER